MYLTTDRQAPAGPAGLAYTVTTPDTQAPAVPANVMAADITATRVTLGWVTSAE